jgi:hypothetical protein
MLLPAHECRQLTTGNAAVCYCKVGRGPGAGVDFLALKCVNVMTATIGDASKCQKYSGKQSELKD